MVSSRIRILLLLQNFIGRHHERFDLTGFEMNSVHHQQQYRHRPHSSFPQVKSKHKTTARSARGGEANAMNTGVLLARGKHVTFLNDFTWLPRDFVSATIQALDSKGPYVVSLSVYACTYPLLDYVD
jgi:hypothetical protein